MKLSSYKEFEARKRALTIGRIGVIAGAHLLVFGVGYFVTKFGSDLEQGQTAVAGANGLVTWSSQASDAQKPTVDTGAGAVFDRRAANIAGYNAGDTVYASAGNAGGGSSSAGSAARSGRYAPRRPSETVRDQSEAPQQEQRPGFRAQQPRQQNDEVLRPIGRPESSSGEGELGETFPYTVRAGDSIWGIAQRFKVTTADVVEANPGIRADSIRVGQTLNVPRQSGEVGRPASSERPPQQGPAASAGSDNGSVYTVKPGDSLSRIASRQGVTVRELRQANGLSSDMIRVGQELTIPGSSRAQNLAERQHSGPKVVVEAGDTLDKIAAMHGVSVREIMDLNEIEDPRRIRINQVLLIPDSRQSASQRPRSQQGPAQAGGAAQQNRESTTPQANRPQAQTQTQIQPSQQQQRQGQPAQRRSLDEISAEEQPQRQSLDALAPDDFVDEDFDDQPLIPIQE